MQLRSFFSYFDYGLAPQLLRAHALVSLIIIGSLTGVVVRKSTVTMFYIQNLPMVAMTSAATPLHSYHWQAIQL